MATVAKQIQKFTADNSPVILTSLGAAGAVITAVISSRVSFKVGYQVACRDMNRHSRDEDKLPTKQILKDYWMEYIPPVLTGAGTVACIIASNKISSSRTAAMATAYALSERTFADYKEKVVEKIGAKKEKNVRAELAEEKVKNNPPDPGLISADGSKVLILDGMSGRYFMGTMEQVRRAQNNINEQVINYSFASLADFYDELGLAPTLMAHDLGWNSDHMLRIEFSAVLTQDNRPCMVLEYTLTPLRTDFRDVQTAHDYS
jgi:hypothetical protein